MMVEWRRTAVSLSDLMTYRTSKSSTRQKADIGYFCYTFSDNYINIFCPWQLKVSLIVIQVKMWPHSMSIHHWNFQTLALCLSTFFILNTSSVKSLTLLLQSHRRRAAVFTGWAALLHCSTGVHDPHFPFKGIFHPVFTYRMRKERICH